jgi:UDP-perosamine 4-acetyltransferase
VSSKPARIVIVGGGGHARVVADVIEAAGCYDVVGYTSLSEADDIPGYRRFGTDEELPRLREDGVAAAFVAIGENALRARLFRHVAGLGFALPSFAHPTSCVSARARVAEGTVLMPGAIVNTGTLVGCGVILNTGASVDHDGRIADFVHVAPGCHLAGTVTVGEGAMLGIGTSVVPGCMIGAWAVVGAGAAVVRDVEERARVVGVPAVASTSAARRGA